MNNKERTANKKDPINKKPKSNILKRVMFYNAISKRTSY